MKHVSMLLLVLCSAALVSCDWMPGPMDPKCDEKAVREFPSPDGSKKVVEYHVTCEGGWYHSTFEIADRNGGHRATAMHADTQERLDPPVWPDSKVEWKSAHELWISYPAGVNAQCISSPPGVAVHCLDASIVRQ